MRYLVYILTIILAVLVFSGCSKSDRKVAKADSKTLTVYEFVEQVPKEYRGKISKEQWIKIAHDWVDEQLLALFAERKGADSDDEVRRRLDEARRHILIDYLRQKVLSAQIEITPEMINEYYESHKSDYIRESDEIKALYISVDNKSYADSVKKALKAGASFCEVARRFSSSYSPRDSCYIGWFTRNDLLPELVKPVFNANVGDVVGPVKAQGSYHFFMILEKKKEGTLRPLDEVRSEIRNQLFTLKLNERLTKIVDSLRTSSDIAVDTALIDSIANSFK